MYCEKCCILFDNVICPRCGSTRVRPEQPDDPCLLTEKSQIWSDMLADVLEKQQIPFLRKGKLGAALMMQVGSFFETYRFYVPAGQLQRAAEIVEELFRKNE